MFCPRCGTEIHGTYCATCGVFTSPATVTTTTSATLAGWWRRVAATLVDQVVLVLPVVAVSYGADKAAGAYAGAAASVLLQGAYLVVLLARTGRTIGNHVAGTKVLDADTGRPITLIQSVRRWALVAAYTLAGAVGPTHASVVVAVSFIGLADCLLPLFDVRRQTVHDKFAGTVVVLA
jgi:uncharacterized RDD family membrane protein YckC